MRIETERLIIRSDTPADVECAAALWSDPEVMRHMGGPRDPDVIRKMMQERCEGEEPAIDIWAVEESGNGGFVGDCGLVEKEIDGEKEVEIVYLFVKRAWGQGYATEAASAVRDHAFKELGLTRLIALIHPENGASGRVAEKLGMKHERDVLRPNGEIRRIYAGVAPGTLT